MAQFVKETVMTLTKDDRAWLAFGNFVLADIKTHIDEEGATGLENTYTGEFIESEDIKKAFWVIDSLIDAQEDWGWKLV